MRDNALLAKVLAFVVMALLATGTEVQAKDEIRLAGDVLAATLPAVAVGTTLFRGDRHGFWQFGEAVSLTVGATYALKYLTGEDRPNGRPFSFPSGHASVSFASAEFLRKRYGWKCGLPAYLAASFVGFSRVQSRAHYVHDVLAGAAIGIGSSYLFTRPYQDWQVRVAADGMSWGLCLSHPW